MRTLDRLGAYWRATPPVRRRAAAHGAWRFPNREATGPLRANSLQKTFAAVVRTSGLTNLVRWSGSIGSEKGHAL